MNARVLHSEEAVASALAELVAGAIEGGVRTLVLAGGTTPRRAYRLLAARTLMWGRVSVLFGDERCVPPDNEESNYAMAKHELLDHVHPGGVLRIPAELGPDEGAELYDAVVRAHSPLDLVLLGVGADGHTASLFPGHPALDARRFVVGVGDAPKPPPSRVSITLGALRMARRVVFAATGADKAEALARAREGAVPAGMLPSAEYILDREAASRI